MSQFVSKESLNAMAALAFKGIQYEGDAEIAVTNLASASDTLSDLLVQERGYNLGNLQDNSLCSTFCSGMEFGLSPLTS